MTHHAAPRSGHGHLDIDSSAPLLPLGKHTGVHQTQIYDIDGDFGIIDGLQLIPNHLFVECPFLDGRRLFRSRIGKTKGIGVLEIDAEHGAESATYRIAVTYGLHDAHRGAGGQDGGVAARNLYRFTIPG